MKLQTMVLSGVVAGGIVLAGAIVVAQTVATPKKVTPPPAPHSIAVDHQGGNGVRRANLPGAGGGQPAAKKHLGNVKYSNRESSGGTKTPTPLDVAKIKSHSNQTNNRQTNSRSIPALDGSSKDSATH